MIRPGTQARIVDGLELAFPWLRKADDVARHFNVPLGTFERNRPHFEKRLTRQQGCATFHAARNVRAFITDPHNLRLLTGEICLYSYADNTLRHAEAEVVRRASGYAPGLAHMADSAHRHHLAHSRQSEAAGVDRTIEGIGLRIAQRIRRDIAPESEKAALAAQPPPKFIDFMAPLAARGERFANRHDIANPDVVQRAIGDVAGSAPMIGAGFIHPVLGAVAAAGDSANLTFNDAIAHGASVEQAEDAALLAGLTGGELALLPGERLLSEFLPAGGPGLWRATRPYVAAGGGAGAMTGGMRAGENLAARATYEPERPVEDGVGASAFGGAVFGSALHAGRIALDSSPGGPPSSRGSPPALNAAIEAVRETTLPQRAPEQALALLRKAAPQTDVVIPTKAIADYAAESPIEAERFVRATEIGEQLQADQEALGDIRIPTPAYVLAVGSDISPGAHANLADSLSMVGREAYAPATAPDGATGSSEIRSEPASDASMSPPLRPQPEARVPSPPDDVNAAVQATVAPDPVDPMRLAPTKAGPHPYPWSNTLEGLPPQTQWQLAREFLQWRRRPVFGDLGFAPAAPWNAGGSSHPENTDPNGTAAQDAADVDFRFDKGMPKRGLVFVQENLGVPKTPAARSARELEDGTPGAIWDVATRNRMVPALLYDNLNPRGRPYVKFDGGGRRLADGTVEIIDTKTRVLTFKSSRGEVVAPKVRAQLLRQERALTQNPGYSGIIEVPDESRAEEARAAIKRLKILNIEVRVTKR